ncbi:GNAT family N-acetyltransferase [Meridianimarinicoccus sp. RP-17]|uniref:GNAT family N-acetyltransferase n=1 Tax=Meridianimarinicoccus zhengii TaxID=2056810 RepID=UPI000DAE7F8D|nr:GNAT family N-acetyltransferase [Phycocomes zhengii]
MILPAGRLDAVLAATWPAAQTCACGPFTLRRSPGGGSRVSAATLDADTVPDAAQIDAAVAAMTGWGQVPRFRIRDGQARFDTLLAARGFTRHDPTLFQAASLTALPGPPPRLSAFAIWPPLAIADEIWRGGGIGPDRRAVMDRVTGPKTAILGRVGDKPGGTAFVAAHDGVAMMHALEIRPQARRKGLARQMVAAAAAWARDRGCTDLAVAVTQANAPARALYAGLGLVEQGRYHYRAGVADAG